MKEKSRSAGLYLLFIPAILIFAAGCSKDEIKDYKYFISKEFKISYSSQFIKNLVDVAAIYFPDISGLKQYVSADVDVYKIVYRTIVNNEEIKASGLICIPSGQGEYPVLCFQNGTNTLSANCPSENVTDLSYQMIEIAASMGYIVVMPDYPGFGESADIPHPYLVKEPTVRSLIDMLFAERELDSGELPGITTKNEYYLIGYSQGGWATLALHKTIELEYGDELNLKASMCGAGPYDMMSLFRSMVNVSTYSMPVYIGYIVNAYSSYNQFINPVSDIFNQPYASRLTTLYNGTHSSSEINNQLTTSIPDLFTTVFLSGFESEERYSSVREALLSNSITPWQTSKPLFLIHGGGDITVDPSATENIYNGIIESGTTTTICKMEIIPALNHSEAKYPAMIKGLLFIRDIQDGK